MSTLYTHLIHSTYLIHFLLGTLTSVISVCMQAFWVLFLWAVECVVWRSPAAADLWCCRRRWPPVAPQPRLQQPLQPTLREAHPRSLPREQVSSACRRRSMHWQRTAVICLALYCTYSVTCSVSLRLILQDWSLLLEVEFLSANSAIRLDISRQKIISEISEICTKWQVATRCHGQDLSCGARLKLQRLCARNTVRNFVQCSHKLNIAVKARGEQWRGFP